MIGFLPHFPTLNQFPTSNCRINIIQTSEGYKEWPLHFANQDQIPEFCSTLDVKMYSATDNNPYIFLIPVFFAIKHSDTTMTSSCTGAAYHFAVRSAGKSR